MVHNQKYPPTPEKLLKKEGRDIRQMFASIAPPLDHSAPLPQAGSKMDIDATKKWPEEGFTREWPEEIKMSPDIKELVDRRWGEADLQRSHLDIVGK